MPTPGLDQYDSNRHVKSSPECVQLDEGLILLTVATGERNKQLFDEPSSGCSELQQNRGRN